MLRLRWNNSHSIYRENTIHPSVTCACMITRRISLVPLQTISRSHFLIPCLVYRHLHSTIFNDIFDNCRFVTIITSSIMKLADHMTYTYIYRSFDPSNFRNRSSIRIPSKGFIFIVPLLVKKKKKIITNRFNKPSIHSYDLLLFQRSNEIFDHSLLHTQYTFQTSSILKIEPRIFSYIYLERRRSIQNKFRISDFCAIAEA